MKTIETILANENTIRGDWVQVTHAKVEAITKALEAAGIEFTNDDAPGLRSGQGRQAGLPTRNSRGTVPHTTKTAICQALAEHPPSQHPVNNKSRKTRQEVNNQQTPNKTPPVSSLSTTTYPSFPQSMLK